MRHFLKSTRGASVVEYAMLLTLIGGIALVAVLSFSLDTRRAFDRSTDVLSSSLASALAAPAPVPVAADDTPPPPPPAPVRPTLTHSEAVYTLRGAWVPTQQGTPSSGYYNTYTPETLTLRVRDRDLSQAVLGSSALSKISGYQTLEYQPPAGAWSHAAAVMDAFALFSDARPGRAFVVPLPRRSQEAAVESGAVWRLYMLQQFTPPASSAALPAEVRAAGVETVYYDCGGREVARQLTEPALAVCPDE